MLISDSSSQLLLIDLQTALIPHIHQGKDVLANACKLARAAELFRVPVTVTEHCPDDLGSTAPELAAFALRGQSPFIKTSFAATDEGLVDILNSKGTPKAAANSRSLPKHLQKPAQNQRTEIIVLGMETHVCLLQTVMGLLDEELDVFVVTDACGSRTQANRDAAFDRLAAEGANLVTTEMVLFEWLRDARHPQFKAVLDLIR